MIVDYCLYGTDYNDNYWMGELCHDECWITCEAYTSKQLPLHNLHNIPRNMGYLFKQKFLSSHKISPHIKRRTMFSFSGYLPKRIRRIRKSR